jgi:MoaA/NifB/PqqE/SkfB family radical SAM enzyme
VAGAIAGTTILRLAAGVPRLRVVAATVNNFCNLRCPHCYLQYDGSQTHIDGCVDGLLVNESYDHLAVVGKEPLVNPVTAAITASLLERVSLAGKTTSLITNGLGLRFLRMETLRSLAYLDVSFDGGPETYSRYRGGAFTKLASGIATAIRNGVQEINALHVLNSATLPAIDDMMRVMELADFKYVMFSPYLVTRNAGTNAVDPLPLRAVLDALGASERFRTAPQAFVLIDSLHLTEDGMTGDELLRIAESLGIHHQVRLFERDPIEYGIMRVTYDGWALSPHDSIHPAEYEKVGFRIQESASTGALGQAFDRLFQAWKLAA